MAIHVQQLFQIVSFLAVGRFFGAGEVLGFLGTIITLAVIVLYVLANFALTTFIRCEHPARFDVWWHGIVPVVGTLLLIPVMFVAVWPIPPYPLDLTPYLFLSLMIVGFVVMKVVEVRRPGARAQGSSMLIGTVEMQEEPQVGQESSGEKHRAWGDSPHALCFSPPLGNHLLLCSFYSCSILQTEFFGRLLAHLELLGFARDGQRKLFHEFEVTRDFIMGNLARGRVHNFDLKMRVNDADGAHALVQGAPSASVSRQDWFRSCRNRSRLRSCASKR